MFEIREAYNVAKVYETTINSESHTPIYNFKTSKCADDKDTADGTD